MTKISDDKVVRFSYVLQEKGGDTLEHSDNKLGMVYLHGHRNILPALESELTGLAEGDTKSIELSPQQAYGEKQEGRTMRVPIKHLINAPKRFIPGMFVKINSAKGVRDATVIKAGRFNIDVDTNHPFAGKTLIFNVSINEVRDAQPEELAHGHAHGPGGHHH